MRFLKQPRDLALLDALDGLERIAVVEPVWRVVRDGRDPLQGHPSAGRWDPGVFDVLYTCFNDNGALAEMHYHLSRQPVFPSKIRFTLNEIQVKTSSTLKFADMRELKKVGVASDAYAGMDYARTREIGDAAAFLGFDGIIAPSARWDCLNLTLFTEQLEPDNLALTETSVIDWKQWERTKAHLKTE